MTNHLLSVEEQDIYDDDLSPEERAIAESRAIKRKGWDPDASTDDNNLSFKSSAAVVSNYSKNSSHFQLNEEN